MKYLINFSLLFVIFTLLLSSCRKSELSPDSQVDSQQEYVSLMKSNDKFEYRGETFQQWYSFNTENASGNLLMQLDAYGNLLTAKLSRNVYLDLLKRSSAVEIESLPQNLINQSKKLSKIGYNYWGSSKFIPPMSKEEFDRKWKDCVNKPTDSGVILCAANLLTSAIMDCINATPPEVKIHCW